VAADLQDTHQAVTKFDQVLALSLLLLLVLLALAAWAQVSMGLKPLRALQRSLQDVREARSPRLQGLFPSEVRPLVDDFNAVLDRNQEVVARARTQAGNLAHALKTPLSVLDQAAARPPSPTDADLARLMREQLSVARRHIDWHLARARLAATQRLPGQRTEIAPALAGLVRVMGKVHANRHLQIQMAPVEATLCFAGEEQDLQEMLGNLLDNACKWARHRVTIYAEPIPGSHPALLTICIEDDGPGIQAEHLQAVMARGVRLDETVPGTGLGLAIVKELADLYGGQLLLAPTPKGGLGVTLTLPATG
jgi:signal transduction histidine kinase